MVFTIQYNTIQYNTIQYNTIQYFTELSQVGLFNYCETYWSLLLYFCGATGLFFLNNKQNNTWMLENIKFISRVDQDILVNTRNKFHISAHSCIIFYIIPARKIYIDVVGPILWCTLIKWTHLMMYEGDGRLGLIDYTLLSPLHAHPFLCTPFPLHSYFNLTLFGWYL